MHIVLSILMILVGSCFALAALPTSASRQWRYMTGLYALAFILALTGAIIMISTGSEALVWFNPSIVSALMIPLVCFLAMILTRYAKSYLDGQPRIGYFQRWFALTLLSVWGVLSSNHMMVFFLAWIGISLCFHRLLMMFPNRPRAALAAHKKFIFARLAEFTLLVAFLLLYHHWQSPWISQWIDRSASLQHLPAPLVTATIMLVITAMIKCAQLPIHGWLIQVVESPTPVSALLHAGIVNLGGFLIILFAPLISASGQALWLLLIWSGLSLLVAALVMHTRISIKVRLAWSTCAQMGFMLFECGLGYYQLATLHLMAHSLYKAYAFLNASSDVDNYLRGQLCGRVRGSLKQLAGSTVISMVLVGLWHTVHPVHLTMGILYVLTLTVLLNSLFRFKQGWLTIPLTAGMFMLCYVLQLDGVSALLSVPEQPLSNGQLVWASSLFVVLAILYWLLRLAPNHPRSQQFYRLLYAGFYLDEWSTRLTLMIWPTELPKDKPVTAKLYPQEMHK